ncbi:MAG: hypothetical protein GY719_35015 [bacterium]|nr:hypothetical protein [bacterium]
MRQTRAPHSPSKRTAIHRNARRLTALALASAAICLFSSTLPAVAWTDCGYSLYIANEGNGGGGTTVVRVDCHGVVTPYTGGFTGTSGLVIEPFSGNLIISDDSPGIFLVDPAGNISPLATSVDFENPNGLALDSLGRLLVADAGNRVLRVTLNPDGSAATVEILAEGFAIPQGVVSTDSGDVLFVDDDGYVYQISPSTPIPVTPLSAPVLPVGAVVQGAAGSIKLDGAGNIYTSDFRDRIVRISPDGMTAKDVVQIPSDACQPDQAGTVVPSFRGLAFDPDGNLVATGYCLDNVYIFDLAALDEAWDTDTPITILPPPFAQNPGGALDGPDLNGPFGIEFWLADAQPPSDEIAIDVKPGSDPNCFNLNGHGVIPVAILGSAGFDVGRVDPSSLLFDGLVVRVRGKKGPLCSFEDFDGDGFTDLVCHFEDEPENWVGGTETATLRGLLFDGTEFQATDSICIVP